VLLIETSESMRAMKRSTGSSRASASVACCASSRRSSSARRRHGRLRRPLDPDTKLAYRRSQHHAIRRAFERYGQNPLIVVDVDFGHTEPQFIIPTGGLVRVDGIAREITVTY